MTRRAVALRSLRSITLTVGAILGTLCILWTAGLAISGVKPLVFLSGSMAPDYPVGAVGFARTVPADEIEAGDVVSVIVADGTRVTHRVVSATPDGDATRLQLKGDANASPDVEQYTVTEVDRVEARVPGLGFTLIAAGSPWGMGVGAAILIACIVLVVPGRRVEDEAEPFARSPRGEVPRFGGAPPAARARARRTLQVVAAAVAAPLMLLGAAAAPTSGTLAYFTDTPTIQSPDAGFGSTAWFTCQQVRELSGAWAYYALDDTGAVAVDGTGNGRNASYYTVARVGGSYAQQQPGNCSDRDTDYSITQYATGIVTDANVASDPDAGTTGDYWNDFTVSIWFKATGTTNGGLFQMRNRVYAPQNGTAHDRMVYINTSGGISFGVYNGAVRSISTSGTDYRDGGWHMVTATLSDAGMKIYVDAVLQASDASVTTGYQFAANNRAAYWAIGVDQTGGPWPGRGSSWLDGSLNNAGIWTSALSDDEIRDMYRATLQVTP